MGIGWVELVEPRLSRSSGGAIEFFQHCGVTHPPDEAWIGVRLKIDEWRGLGFLKCLADFTLAHVG